MAEPTDAPGRTGLKAGEIPGLLKKFGIEPRRGLSQNFLVSDGASAGIAAACGADGCHAIEIGAGPGILTRLLARTAARVTAFEIDERFRPFHAAAGLPANVDLVYADFLTVDLAARLDPAEPAVIVGNIPYAVTGLIFRKALDPALPIRRVGLLVQEEAARRVAAGSGRAYGILSVAAWLFGDARVALIVKPGSFHPAPRIRSAFVVVERVVRDLGGADPARFMNFVHTAFGQRRKTLANALAAQGGAEAKARTQSLLERLGLPADARPETVSPPRLVEIYRNLGGICGWGT